MHFSGSYQQGEQRGRDRQDADHETLLYVTDHAEVPTPSRDADHGDLGHSYGTRVTRIGHFYGIRRITPMGHFYGTRISSESGVCGTPGTWIMHPNGKRAINCRTERAP